MPHATSKYTDRTFNAANVKTCPRILPANLPLHGICGTASKTLNHQFARTKPENTIENTLARTSTGLPFTDLLPMAAAATGAPRVRQLFQQRNPQRLQQTKPRQKSATLSNTAYHYSVPLQNRASSCTTRRLVSGPRRRCAGCPWRRTCA